MIPVFFHSIFGGLVLPLSNFLRAIHDHYHIHLLHLQSNSILLLSIFVYLYEAFVGVMHLVALFRAFYNLRISALNQRTRCASFHIINRMAGNIINIKILKKVEGFRSCWVYVDTRQITPFLMILTIPAMKSSE